MNPNATQQKVMFEPFLLPCGSVLKNRIVKSAMSDSLGDGTGHPTQQQCAIYDQWAAGGVAASIIGEVQCTPNYAEKPGNLVLNENSKLDRFRKLAECGGNNNSQIWLQLGHAGALAYPQTSTPKGPSSLDLPGLVCGEMTVDEINELPMMFAKTASLAKEAGFAGVQLHAAHGFLFSQFLSPLFNQRADSLGGSIANRMEIVLKSVQTVREAVGPTFPIAIKLNSSDQLEGGLSERDSLEVVRELDKSSIDLIDISGGTYFPGAKAASDGTGSGPYFWEYATKARSMTAKPLMLTGGFKTYDQAANALEDNIIDVVGLARTLVLDPELPNKWKSDNRHDPTFPRFSSPPEGGVTAWYTMRITALAENQNFDETNNLSQLIEAYESRDKTRAEIWNTYFDRPV